MSNRLSHRVSTIKPSPTLAITTRAAEMRAKGLDVIGLGAGEPDFDTPDHIKEAAERAIKDGFTKYTAVDGTPSLKRAIIAKFQRDNGLDYQPDQILVSCGGKQSFFNMAQALLNPGDEAIIPSPYWVSYPDMCLLAGAQPVFIQAPTSQHFKITPEQLRAAISPRTRLFVINSPSNPSGMAYSLGELQALAEVLLEYPDIIVATDDMYEHIHWSGAPFVNILNACPDLKGRTLVLNGVSKAYSMTGWRIGYACGPKALMAAMTKMQSQSTSNATSIAQKASVEALNGPQDAVAEMVKEFEKRRTYIVDRLNAIPGVTCFKSTGAFYAFPNFSGVYGKTTPAGKKIENSSDFAAYLLEDAKVALVPGVAFGDDRYARLSYATSLETIKKGLDRIEEAIGNLK